MNILESFDWQTIVTADPGLGVTLLSREGDITFVSPGAHTIFGVDPNVDVVGRNVADLFHSEFADERMRWARQAISQHQRLRAAHIYQGRAIVSTLIPLENTPAGSGLLVISRPDGAGAMPDGAVAVDAFAKRIETKLIDLEPLDELTDRELEVLVLLGRGLSVPETAKLLYRSSRTIEAHKNTVGKKLGNSTLATLASIVAEAGLTVDHLSLKRCRALRREFASGSLTSVQKPPSTDIA